LATLFHGEGYALILTNDALGNSLGVFSQTNLVTLLALQEFTVVIAKMQLRETMRTLIRH
jgi:hypothetical protein